MRHAALIALLLAVAALAAVEATLSGQDPTDPAPAPAPAPALDPAAGLAQPEAMPEPPAAAEPAPAEPVAPLAVQAPAPAPLPVPPPAAEFIHPGQSLYGPIASVEPAHQVAIMEAGPAVAANDPLVARSAALLAQLTARYVEDAPRIAELTIKVCRAVREAKQPASPLEVLDGALRWKRPARPAGNVPRRFEGYAALYRAQRLVQGKDHAGALAAIVGLPQVPPPPPKPAPR